MPTLDDFWSLDCPSRDDRKWMFLEFSQRIEEFGPNAKVDVIGEELIPDRPIPFRIGYGKAQPDAYFSAGGRPLYSGRLIRAMQKVGCRGLRPIPAVLYDKSDKKVVDEDLFLVYPERGSGPVDETRGDPLQIIEPDRWKRDMEMEGCYGLYFDPETWTGLDIFYPIRDGNVIVTRKIAEVIQAGKFNVRLTPVLLHGKDMRDARVAALKKRFPHGWSPPPK